MDKILVVIFDNESKAYEGSVALEQLHDQGSIDLYSQAVMVRKADGQAYVKQSSDPGPAGTAVGLVTGTLMGLFGGPTGIVAGAGLGTSGGFLYDLAHLGVGFDYLDEVGQSLKPGKAALVAEIWEDQVMPVDSKMESLGGVVFRRTRRDILDSQVQRDLTLLKADMEDLKAEHNRASGVAQRKLQEKMDTDQAKLQRTMKGIQARLETSQQETEAKIQSLQAQAAKARGEQKAKREQRIAELKAEQKRRNDQLKQTSENVNEKIGA